MDSHDVRAKSSVIYSQFMKESTPIKRRPLSLHCLNTCDHCGINTQRSRGSTGLCRWLQALIDTSCSDAGLSQAWTGSLEFRHGKSYVVRQWKMYLNWATIKIYSLTQHIYAKQQLYKVATTRSKILVIITYGLQNDDGKTVICQMAQSHFLFLPLSSCSDPLHHQNRVTRGSCWNLP